MFFLFLKANQDINWFMLPRGQIQPQKNLPNMNVKKTGINDNNKIGIIEWVEIRLDKKIRGSK